MKLAIIGASIGQYALCKKALELGVETYCFAWEKGAICRSLATRFYPISIFEVKEIERICREEGVEGVLSNASDVTARVVSEIATDLHLRGLNRTVYGGIMDKSNVRRVTNGLEGLDPVPFEVYDDDGEFHCPCVVKPVSGSSKCGVSFVKSAVDFDKAIAYAQSATEGKVLIEQCVDGEEFSVETLSYEGRHHVIQITDKQNTGAPHFVEIGHHQPSSLGAEIKERIKVVVPRILTAVGFTDGAAHVEMKVKADGSLCLIEVNPRGGGDEISNTLVGVSTEFDYLKGMIHVALGCFDETSVQNVHDVAYAGIYFLCKQTERLLPFFEDPTPPGWMIGKHIESLDLSEATGNGKTNGYLVYKGDHRIAL